MNPRNYQQSINKQDDRVFDIKKIVFTVIGVVALVVAVSAGIVFIPKLFQKTEVSEEPTVETPKEEEKKTPEKINLQHVVDKWLADQPNQANSEIMVYDLDNNEIVARHNEETSMYIASIYKMFVVYEGYYRIDHGVWKATDGVGLGNNYDGKAFDYATCLDYAIRYSYSACAENLWAKIGHSNLQSIYNEKGFENTNIEGITSTPADLVKLYKMYWKHSDLSDESWEKIKDSMLDQTAPSNAYDTMKQDWRRGLPSGFATAKVYDKVGWLGDGSGNWYYYADAAFTVFPETKDKNGETVPERSLIVVILTKDTKPSELVKFGRELESAVKSADNY